VAQEEAMADPQTFNVLVRFENGEMARCAAITYQGNLWLVPKWRRFESEGYVEPERMIRLDQFSYRSFEKPHELDFAVDRIPRGLFDGELSQELKDAYVVLEKSDARFHVGGIGN
jgi:hypothetical protein